VIPDVVTVRRHGHEMMQHHHRAETAVADQSAISDDDDGERSPSPKALSDEALHVETRPDDAPKLISNTATEAVAEPSVPIRKSSDKVTMAAHDNPPVPDDTEDEEDATDATEIQKAPVLSDGVGASSADEAATAGDEDGKDNILDDHDGAPDLDWDSPVR
jgi:hypothetical protein